MIFDKWRRLLGGDLEEDLEATHLDQWVGFYCDCADNLAFVL